MDFWCLWRSGDGRYVAESEVLDLFSRLLYKRNLKILQSPLYYFKSASCCDLGFLVFAALRSFELSILMLYTSLLASSVDCSFVLYLLCSCFFFLLGGKKSRLNAFYNFYNITKLIHIGTKNDSVIGNLVWDEQMAITFCLCVKLTSSCTV